MSTEEPRNVLPAGSAAPEFTLWSTPTETLSLSSLRGRPVVLAFYPADWSPVCSDQMAIYSQIMPVFEEYHAAVLGISVDGVWSHQAFVEAHKLRFPLLADFEPKGEIARRYGAYDYKDGCAQRALFVLDGDGTIAWSFLSPPALNPGADGILDALDALKQRRSS
jgi:peroxiredoxin